MLERLRGGARYIVYFQQMHVIAGDEKVAVPPRSSCRQATLPKGS
jgi:hypothetical protein